MLSEIDIRDFDKQPVTPLYSVKPKTYVQCPRTEAVYYFDHIDAVIFVIDSTDEEKLMFAKDELRRLLNNGGTSTMASS